MEVPSEAVLCSVLMPMHAGSNLGILKNKIAEAQSVTVLTGAGISADSGVPTFRGTDGLWRTIARKISQHLKPLSGTRVVWEWYNWRRELIATKQPNPAHEAVVELERRNRRFWLITQNVDGLHRAAGSQKTFRNSWQHLEGSLYRL